MKHNKKQPFRGPKEGISIFMAGLLGVLGIGGGTLILKTLIDDNDTSIVEPEDLGLILTEDFDINDESAVRKRAEAIYNISEKDITIEEIMNVIYFMNGKYESLILNGTDRENVIDLNGVLDTVILDMTEIGISNEDIITFKDGVNRLSIATSNKDINSILEEYRLLYSILPSYARKSF